MKRAFLHRFDGRLHARICREQNHQRVGIHFLDPAQHRDPVDVGQLVIQQDEIDTIARVFKRLGAGTRFDDIVPQLKACASSPTMFINTATTSSVGDAFKAIYNTYKTVRLSQ